MNWFRYPSSTILPSSELSGKPGKEAVLVEASLSSPVGIVHPEEYFVVANDT